MSEAIRGVVSKVSFKENAQPDKFENTHRASILVDDVWYGFGGVKDKGYGPGINIKDGQGWHQLAEGDTVQFFTKSREYNGKTYFDKDGQVKLVAKGNGAAAPASKSAGTAQSASGSSTTKAGTTAGSSAKGPNPEYAVGRWVNGAVALVQSGKVADLNAGIIEVARIEVWATANFQSILDQVTPKAPAPAAPAKQAAKAGSAPTNDGFDDDIPF